VGNDGWIRWLEVTDINKTSGPTTTYTPHHIDAALGSAYGWADPSMTTSREIIIDISNAPLAEDIAVLDSIVLRTNQINVVANGSDVEDLEEFLIPHFEYRDPAEASWESAYFGVPTYMGTSPTGYWEIPFTPPITAMVGFYDFRVRFEDNASYVSNWEQIDDVVFVLNNLPYVEDMYNDTSPPGFIYRGDTAWIYGDGEDIEDGDDQNFTAAEFQYKRPGDLWGAHTTYWTSSSEKSVNDWRRQFTPEPSTLTPIGLYGFRVRFQDLDGDWCLWENLENITVENAIPDDLDLSAGQPQMFRGESSWIFANATDAEELESDLTVEFYYDEPGGGTVWIQGYLSSLTWDATGFWRIQFTLPSDAPLGLYNFKVVFTDSHPSSNETIVNGLVNVTNSLPEPIDITPSSATVSAGVGSIFMNVNAMDLEDAEDELTIEVEYSLSGMGIWESTYIGSQTYFGSVPTGYLRVTFQPDGGATLGLYDIRVRVHDTDGGTSNSPEWIYAYDAVEVVSQIYTVDYIVIRDAPNNGGNIVLDRTYGVAEVATFYAAGGNFTGGYVADVDVTWSSDASLVGNVTTPGPSTTFTALQVAVDSTCNVTVTYQSVITNSTGILTVLAPTMDGIEIRSDPAGGGLDLSDPLNYPDFPVGHTTSFHGAIINNSIGYLMDVPASSTWDSSDDNKVTVLTPGISTTVTCDDVNWGTVTITLTDLVMFWNPQSTTF
jgi:hypothetical protein